jgi:oxygen-dependent protoporphyrinogen oxidase
MRVTVVGAGLTGLFSAYYLKRAGHDVIIYESSERVGGLVQTLSTPYGPVETAANGMLNSPEFEEMCEVIGCEMTVAKSESRKRFIFRNGKARRWPLNIAETLVMIFKFFISAVTFKLKPRPSESVDVWASRVFGSGFSKQFLGPALSGIYAGDIEMMSAPLIFNRFFIKNKKKPLKNNRGLVAPLKGMGDLANCLKDYLVLENVKFKLSELFILSKHPSNEPLIIATSSNEASKCLREKFSEVAQKLGDIDTLPLVTATFFVNEPLLKGFGCLFPKQEKFSSLGVLFNTEIFEGRSKDRKYFSETWILGGAFNRNIISLSDSEITTLIREDRARLGGMQEKFMGSVITRWPSVLPHYTLELEKTLNLDIFLKLKNDLIFLQGRYNGTLGLSRILLACRKLPLELNRK